MTALLGGWRLESWSLVYGDGRLPEYPTSSTRRAAR